MAHFVRRDDDGGERFSVMHRFAQAHNLCYRIVMIATRNTLDRDPVELAVFDQVYREFATRAGNLVAVPAVTF